MIKKIKEMHNKRVSEAITPVINTIKEELDEHLDSINANTREIQNNYDYLCELDGKINKLNEKLDEIQYALGIRRKKEKLKRIILTLREQEVFLKLYTAEEPISMRQLARILGFNIEMTQDCIDTILGKGVPIIKRYSETATMVLLDQEFKDLQAKENIVSINEAVVRQIG